MNGLMFSTVITHLLFKPVSFLGKIVSANLILPQCIHRDSYTLALPFIYLLPLCSLKHRCFTLNWLKRYNQEFILSKDKAKRSQ